MDENCFVAAMGRSDAEIRRFDQDDVQDER